MYTEIEFEPLHKCLRKKCRIHYNNTIYVYWETETKIKLTLSLFIDCFVYEDLLPNDKHLLKCNNI